MDRNFAFVAIIERWPDKCKSSFVLIPETGEIKFFKSVSEALASDEYDQCQDPKIINLG